MLFYYSSLNAGQLELGINLFDLSIVLVVNLLQGTAYLLYLLCCWVAEVCFNKFRMIKWLFIIVLISSLPIYTVAFSATSNILHSQPMTFIWFYQTLGAIFILIYTTGLGIFESNAIQFGMDQMLEASSEQLSSFVHWYFWCAHVVPRSVFYIGNGFALY